MKNKLKLPSKIHFIGIGGAGMNPLAGICLKNGVRVTGSDSTANKNQDELRALGADIWTPHSVEELQKRDLPEVCAYSTAILPSNPEYAYLKERGVEFWHRSDLLQKIADQFDKQIVIAGTHGKTTTTAMLIWMLEQAGLKPCWVLGGVLKGLGSYGWNDDQREMFIFEGDESDQSFLKSNPYIGLVTSLEPDHLENYQNSFEVQIQKFQEFARKSKHFICCIDCKNARAHLAEENVPSENCYGELNNGLKEETTLEQLFIERAPGQHNQLNALGALVAANKLNLSKDKMIHSLSTFPGIYRRFEIIGTTESGTTVIDDYAHHPTEVRAAIKGGRDFLNEREKKKNLKGKLIVAFQPHLPTRLRDLWKEFTECFEEADVLFLNDLYIARGKPIEGIDSENLAKQIKHSNLTHVKGSPQNLVQPLIETAKPNDLILLLGAGDITYIRETLFEKLS